MNHVFALTVSVIVFLIVIAILLWSRHETLEAYETRSQQFLLPSTQRLSSALHALDRAAFRLSQDVLPDDASRAIPYRFELQSFMDAIGRDLAEAVRLAHEFDYDGAFGLPSRAYEQYEQARLALLGESVAQQGRRDAILGKIAPLRDTLAQLERIYELEHLDWEQRERDAARASTRFIGLVCALLLLVATPLITSLVRGLRAAMRREARTRNDLEEAKQNLETMALRDALTGIGNRHLFRSRLEHVARAAARAGHFSALLYIDLDDFKRVNDGLGHDVGDEVLRVIASRLKEKVRAGDAVARIGGDEFTVILSDAGNGAAVGAISQKLLGSVREPIIAGGQELVLTASIGITVMPDDGDDPAALMKNADMALYRAKDQGRNNFQFFVEELNLAAARQAMLERELRAALQERRFEVHYQPQLALHGAEVCCVEALLRWSTRDGRSIPPAEFIPVAESAGLLVEIGAWVFERVCRDISELRARGHRGLRAAVNLSARQLRDPKLLTRIDSALAASGLAADALEVEITESTLIEDLDAAVTTLHALRRLGITVAVDDFGTGYSSLSYLRQLPLDVLKIDRSFVRDIESDADDRSIVDAVLAMGHSLSLEVVAEGVETQWQLDYLAARGCDRAQGYLIARPSAVGQLTFPPPGDTGARQPPTPAGGLRVV